MNVRPELEELSIAIDDVHPHPRNARRGDVSKLTESLSAHGQYRPIVVRRETNEILAGNHTWRAAKELGWETIAVTYVDCDDEQALRILLADNRYSDTSQYDEGSLIDLLEILSDTEEGLTGTGYDSEALASLTALDFSGPGSDTSDMPEGIADILIRVGIYRILVSQGSYSEWQEKLRQTTGFEEENIKAEILKRLGL